MRNASPTCRACHWVLSMVCQRRLWEGGGVFASVPGGRRVSWSPRLPPGPLSSAPSTGGPCTSGGQRSHAPLILCTFKRSSPALLRSGLPRQAVLCSFLQGLRQVPVRMQSLSRCPHPPSPQPHHLPHPHLVPTRPPGTPAKAGSRPWSSLMRRAWRWTPPLPPCTQTTVTPNPAPACCPPLKDDAALR